MGLAKSDSAAGADSLDRIVGHFSCAEHDALWTALHRCAGCYRDEPKPYTDADMVYGWITASTRHGIVCDLVDELHNLGFSILPNVSRQRPLPAETDDTNTNPCASG